MRLLNILFVLFIFFISVANAKTNQENISLKQLIQKVKNSTGDNRRIAMNALKVKLRSMNHEVRQQVLYELKKSFSGNPNSMGKNYKVMLTVMHYNKTVLEAHFHQIVYKKALL